MILSTHERTYLWADCNVSFYCRAPIYPRHGSYFKCVLNIFYEGIRNEVVGVSWDYRLEAMTFTCKIQKCVLLIFLLNILHITSFLRITTNVKIHNLPITLDIKWYATSYFVIIPLGTNGGVQLTFRLVTETITSFNEPGTSGTTKNVKKY